MIDRAALAAAFEETADKLADVAYNHLQKSEEANEMFDRGQQFRRLAKMCEDETLPLDTLLLRIGNLENTRANGICR